MVNASKKRSRTAAKSKSRSNTRKSDKTREQKPLRSGTKQFKAVELLRAPAGASIDALMKATGWQQHSVRGFLAGVVRKRLNLNLVSALDGGIRVYRITNESIGAPSKPQANRPTP